MVEIDEEEYHRQAAAAAAEERRMATFQEGAPDVVAPTPPIDWEAWREAARNQMLPKAWWDDPVSGGYSLIEESASPLADFINRATSAQAAVDKIIGEQAPEVDEQVLGFVVAQQAPPGAAAAGAVGLAGWVFDTEEEARQALADARLLGWRIARLVVR